MAWDNRYRRLEKGETILPGDEVEMENPYGWQPAVCVYQPAPDPSYTAHRIYRRPLTAGRRALDGGQE